MSIIEKLKKARNLRIDVRGVVFLARRPTDLQAAKWHSNRYNLCEIAAESVYGWEGFKSNLVSPDLPETELPFDVELWQEWIEDNQEYWGPITDRVLSAYADYRKSKDGAVKN